MSALHAVPLALYPARRIALLKPSALGDIVHSLPVLTALRERYPAAHIAWVVNRAYAPLLEGHPDLDETIAFDRNALRTGVGQTVLTSLRFLSGLRSRQFDLVIDLQGLLRTGLMTLASGAARRVGLASAREGAAWAYTDSIAVADDMHAIDRYWLVAEALGVTTKDVRFKVPVAPAALQWALSRLHDMPKPWLMFGVGARWLTKRWPPQHFAALAQKAQRDFGGTAVFVGGADESALARLAAAELAGPGCDLTGKTSLPHLVAVLSLADVMIANDTGPLHLAVALGRPVVAPYLCTRVRLTGPYDRPASAVATSVHCAGSLLKKCDRLECMNELTPARLWPLLEEVLSQWQRAHRCA
jgi:lipopolysaccharide heptosyltransferase I